MSFRGSARSPDPRPYNQQSHYRDASPGGVALTTPHAKLVVVSDMVDMLLSDHMIMGHESHLLRYLGAVCASRRKCVSRSRTLLIVRAYAYSRQIWEDCMSGGGSTGTGMFFKGREGKGFNLAKAGKDTNDHIL